MTQHDPAAAEWRPGNQSERTAMAWMRTSIGLFVTASAATRLGSLAGLPEVEALGVLTSLACVLSIALWWRRFRRSTDEPGVASARFAASRGAASAAVVAVCGAGLAGLTLAVAAFFE